LKPVPAKETRVAEPVAGPKAHPLPPKKVEAAPAKETVPAKEAVPPPKKKKRILLPGETPDSTKDE
jgi:hypothetical protein